jgi:hypothetical protein
MVNLEFKKKGGEEGGRVLREERGKVSCGVMKIMSPLFLFLSLLLHLPFSHSLPLLSYARHTNLRTDYRYPTLPFFFFAHFPCLTIYQIISSLWIWFDMLNQLITQLLQGIFFFFTSFYILFWNFTLASFPPILLCFILPSTLNSHEPFSVLYFSI